MADHSMPPTAMTNSSSSVSRTNTYAGAGSLRAQATPAPMSRPATPPPMWAQLSISLMKIDVNTTHRTICTASDRATRGLNFHRWVDRRPHAGSCCVMSVLPTSTPTMPTIAPDAPPLNAVDFRTMSDATPPATPHTMYDARYSPRPRTRSTAGPSCHNTSMLSPMWSTPKWTTIGVKSRHHCPWMPLPLSARVRSVLMWAQCWSARWTSQTATVTTTIETVTGASTNRRSNRVHRLSGGAGAGARGAGGGPSAGGPTGGGPSTGGPTGGGPSTGGPTGGGPTG